MSLLVAEILLALVALQRGWRLAPVLLVALPVTVLSFESVAAALLAPWVGPYFEPAGVAGALAHGAALIGLLVACWAGPSEQLTGARRLSRPALRRTGSLYQI
jgi:hypothetical protein